MVNEDGSALTDAQKKIEQSCDGMKGVLLYKNLKYGNSALHPLGLFTTHIKEGAEFAGRNSILVRLDDKCSRVMNADELRPNDVADIIGYCHLLLVDMGFTEFDKFKD